MLTRSFTSMIPKILKDYFAKFDYVIIKFYLITQANRYIIIDIKMNAFFTFKSSGFKFYLILVSEQSISLHFINTNNQISLPVRVPPCLLITLTDCSPLEG